MPKFRMAIVDKYGQVMKMDNYSRISFSVLPTAKGKGRNLTVNNPPSSS